MALENPIARNCSMKCERFLVAATVTNPVKEDFKNSRHSCSVLGINEYYQYLTPDCWSVLSKYT